MKTAKQHCLGSGKGRIWHNRSVWVMFLCHATLEITPGSLLLLSGQGELSQTWPNLYICFVLSKIQLLLFNSLHKLCGVCSLLVSNWWLPHREVRGCPVEWRNVQALIWEFRGFVVSAVAVLDGILLSSRCPEKANEGQEGTCVFYSGC